MNKAELISKVAESTNFTKKDTELIVSSVFETIEKTLVQGERVQIIGFGCFEVRDRKARLGRKPKEPTTTVHIPESKAPVFKAGKALKELINPKSK